MWDSDCGQSYAGEVYIGCFSQGQRNGMGICTYIDGR